ncbi:MAG: tripartite tricarboxylate transporter permease [Thiolinea sp.]
MAVDPDFLYAFSWDVNNALALMVGVFMGGVYGGSRTSITLLGVFQRLGVATALDGCPMAQKGEAGNLLRSVHRDVGGQWICRDFCTGGSRHRQRICHPLSAA